MFSRYRPVMPVSLVERELAFKDSTECLKFLGQLGVVLSDDREKVDCKLSAVSLGSG